MNHDIDNEIKFKWVTRWLEPNQTVHEWVWLGWILKKNYENRTEPND